MVLQNMVDSLSAVLLPIVFGKILDHFNANSTTGYLYGFIIPVIFSILGLIRGILVKGTEKQKMDKLANE